MKERKLQTLTNFYQNNIKTFYERAHRAKEEGKLVVWTASTFPVEILLAMDMIPVWPENYASICAARRASVPMCELAERKGFSKDLCSYARCVIGSLFNGKSAPETGIPKPDILVASTSACDTHLKWFQIASRIFKKPLLLLDVPYNAEGSSSESLPEHHIQYYVSQLKGLVNLLEKHSGNHLRAGNLRKVIKLSSRTSKLWLEIQNCRRNTPAPMGAREAFSAVYFLLCIPGTEEAVSFYERLLGELAQRVEERIGVVDNERYRLIWDNLPLWFDLHLFRNLEASGAVVVAETFSHIWLGRLDPSSPFESLARKYLPNMANSAIKRRIELIVRLINDFQANGVILPTNWGCRMMTIGETLVKRRIQEETGIPSLILDVDSTDWRNYDEYRVKTKLETYLRTLL